MAIAAPRKRRQDHLQDHPTNVPDRVRATVALLERRGYSLSARDLGRVCLGGPLPESQVVAAMEGAGLRERSGIVCSDGFSVRAGVAAARQAGHSTAAETYLAETVAFARTLAGLFPFIIAVSIAGSLASGGFAATDDVDLNLVVEDGFRHVAYFVLNAYGVLHALRHRGKPVDSLSARPLSPRVMTANLVLERSQCFPLARTDKDMAYELMASRTVVGAGFLAAVVVANAELLRHFPQLAERPAAHALEPHRRLPAWLFSRLLDVPARTAGRAAWRYLQWTRRHSPEALARVAFVRTTMRPYTLFDDAG